MISLSVDADIAAGTDLFGKTVSDLQTGIVVGNDAITGTLKYVSDYSSAYGPGEDSGNYLVIHCESETDDATITVEVVGGTSGPQTLDEDGIIICRIADKDAQSIRVIATAGGKTNVHNYRLSGLTCQGEA